MSQRDETASPGDITAIVRRLEKDMMAVKAAQQSRAGRGRRFAMRLYDQEFEKLEALANGRGLSMSDWARERFGLPIKGVPLATDEVKPRARRARRAAGGRAKRRT